VLGIPIGTLMSRLGRARAALRTIEAPERLAHLGQAHMAFLGRRRRLLDDVTEGVGVARLRRYARSLTRDSAQADDLVHDTLVRALERQGTLLRSIIWGERPPGPV
jgi:DNA-directed RNA polymerase specialized sigma24 family protein